MLIFALFLKMSNGATYSVVPFINKRAMGAVSGIVGAGGNVGAVLAGLLFASGNISYQKSLLIIGMGVSIVSVFALLMALSLRIKVQPETEKVEPRLKEAFAFAETN
jgi:NNP family nitrate/nitrite transporter-like MFS transporter